MRGSFMFLVHGILCNHFFPTQQNVINKVIEKVGHPI